MAHLSADEWARLFPLADEESLRRVREAAVRQYLAFLAELFRREADEKSAPAPEDGRGGAG